MENYIVSARKYRPSTFESVVGQRALTTTLKNAIATGKLAHAYLFCGPRGVGKTTCARIFAKTINCLSPTETGEACNECESCRAFNEQRSYNIHELDAASNNSVDDIRQLVEQVRIPPQIGRYKVYIIDEVHMLSASAFNAFLKTLEEPPRHAIFILATTEKHKILPTILSRCQIYDFNRISVDDTITHLAHVAAQEGITAEPEALNVIALKADGGMRDALSIFDQVVSFSGGNITYQSAIENLNVLDYDYYFKLTEYFLANRVSDSLLLLNEVLSKGFDGSHFITGLASHLRDLLVGKDEVTLPLLEVGAGIRERYRVQAQKCPLPFLYSAMKLCNDCDLNYRNSKNKRLLVELTLIQVAQLTADTTDETAGGRSPKQSIKPIFTPTEVKPQTRTAAPTAGTTTATPQPSVPTGAQQTPPTTPAQQPGKFRVAASEKKPQLRSIGDLNLSPKQQPVKEEKPHAETPTTALPEENRSFSEQDINFYWQRYAQLMPKEEIAIVKRMKHMHMTLINETTFEAVVENELIAKEFARLVPEVQEYMRRELKNRRITMTVRVSAPTEKPRAYSQREKFQLMAQKNKALLSLQKQFGLELA